MRLMLLVLQSGALLLAACGDHVASTETRSDATAHERVPIAHQALAQALQCWGLTNRAHFLHKAKPEESGNLPNPGGSVVRAWAIRAETLAKESGMAFAEYEQHRKAVRKTGRVHFADVEPSHAEAVQTCMDRVPETVMASEQARSGHMGS